MAVRRGISILDLLPQTSGVALQIPDGIVEQIGVLTILDHRSTTSGDFYLHEGTLQSVADALNVDTSAWALRIPGLTHGLRFRLAINRQGTPAPGSQEANPTLWTLDIEVWDVEILIPGVQAAKPVGGTGVTPLTLQATGTTDASKRVYLVASGVVRISGGGPAGTQVQVVDSPDPFDPTAPTGAVVRLTAHPSSFLFGDSKFGMTLDQFVIDLSKTFTPAEIVARGHDEVWEGVSFKETTFYFPPSTPLVHSLSVSARDVIIGEPGGLQGELRIEFGQDFNNLFNSRIAVKEQTAGGGETDVAETTTPPRIVALEYAITPGMAGAAKRIRAVFAVGAGELITGHTDLAAVGVWWKLPDGSEGTSPTTPWFDAPTTRLLHYRLRLGNPSTATNTASPASAVPTDQIELIEVTVAFPRAAGGPTGVAPLIDATIDGTTLRNVLHIRGPRARLAGVTLNTRSGNANWTLGGGSAPVTRPGAPSFVLPMLPDGTTTLDLVVADTNGSRRVRIDVVPTGPLTVGHQSSTVATSPSAVTVVGTGDASPTSVTETFLAARFHAVGDRPAAPAPATFTGATITVPRGADAEVEVPVPTGALDPLPPAVPQPTNTPTTVQITYNWDQAAPIQVLRPYVGLPTTDAPSHDPDARPMADGFCNRPGFPGDNVTAQLTSWMNDLGPANGRKFYVVGRTDDLKFSGTKADNDTYNNGLATNRANAARDALVAAGVAAGDILVTNEVTGFSSDPPGSPPPRINAKRRLALPWPQTPPFPATTAPVFNRLWNPDGPAADTHQTAKTDPHRPPYRTAEIYVVDTGSPAPPPAIPAHQDGVPTRILVPGPDGAPDPGVVSTTTATPPTDYRVRLMVKWDSPTVVSLADAVPTEAEALVAWKSASVELPASAHGTTPPPPIPAPTGPDYWEVLLHWAYDARTGETEATGALSLPDGTLTVAGNALAGALAFGPAITALANPGDVVADPTGEYIAAVAILALGAAIGSLINTGTTPSTVDIDKFGISYKWNGAAHVAATVDYTIDLRVNVTVAGSSLVGHLRLRYKGVGLRFDGAPGGGLAGVALTYDGLSVEVVDPGTWSLGGPLGSLIRIAASRMGNGSQWMEFDLEFALDLGVVRLEGATIRMMLPSGTSPFSVEFRGLAASIDIPATIKGRGAVAIGDGGSFRALLAIEVIPAKLSAYGSLAVDQDFVAIELGVQLPVGLPIGGTGFGIFGFMGRFVANGTRNLDGLTNPDPVQRQLDWYVRSPEQKYSRKSGQFAFGVGAVIGTLPDSGFTFNAEGTLAVGFPDISVIFGIDAHLAAQRKSQATESGTASTSTFRILGMVLIEPDSIMVAVRASYEIPKVLKLQIPLSAYFPLAGGDAWYIRIGTDNEPLTPDHPARPGSPVTITLLPDSLNVRAWAFVMIEERQLHHLGGALIPLDLAASLDFDGFSIGIGAGFDLKYTAGPFSIEITAFLVVGLGTKPVIFAGIVGIKGELDLVVVSVGVDGELHFNVSPGYNYLEGHFCGHVDLFFFTVSGCVDIRIGDSPPSDIPVPESPLAGMDLCDHLSAVKGTAARTPAETAPTVWPDTVAVLRFAHFIDEAPGASADFVRKLPEPATLSPWSGSTELKYAFRLKTVELWKLTGTDPATASDWTKVGGPFDSAWWMPTWRKAVITGGGDPGPSTEEGRELGLFSWDPRAWSRWLTPGSENLPGNPANTIGEICNPAGPADPSCAFGKDRTYKAETLGAFKAAPATTSVFPSRFTAFAELPDGLDTGTLAALGADAGWTWSPGAVAPLSGSVPVGGVATTQGWRFPAWRAMGQFVSTAPIVLSLSKPLLEGALLLEVCGKAGGSQNDPTVCDTMPERDATLDGFTGQSGTKYQGGSLQASGLAGERALTLGTGNLFGVFGGVTDGIAVDLEPGHGTTVLKAFGADGQVLGEAQAVGANRQRLAVDAAGITQFRITSDGKPILFKVCWGRRPAIHDLVNIEPLTLPRAIATDVDGKQLVLDATVVAAPGGGTAAGASHVASAVGALNSGCPMLVFELPKGAGWTKIEIAPWTGGNVSLVALCGVTVEAQISQAADDAYRTAMKDLLTEWVAAATDNQPTHKVYLDQSSMYEVRVAWQYQGFRPANPGDEPAPPTSGGWLNPANDERFRFSTAAFGLAATPAPVETTSLDVDPAQGGPGYDERTFDPRGLSRYVTRAAPDHEDPPHFLDDRVGFWFMADHLEPLVEKYDRTLQAKVLHTRPAAGTVTPGETHVAGKVHDLDVTVRAEWKVETDTWFDADLQLVNAVEASPCIGGTPAVGSSSVSVTANLEPHSEYDLLLNTAPKVVGAHDEVPVARSHFRTSRYRNPTELLRALGFASPLGLSSPTDALAVAALPAGSLAVGDAELDAALTTLGLDPWPLAIAPRTTVIWLTPATGGDPWRVAAVLVEADEPVWRPGFMTGALGEPVPPPRLEVNRIELFRTYEHTMSSPPPAPVTTTTVRNSLGAMTERIRNSSGTRSLFTATSPIAVENGRLYDLELQFNENGSPGASGRAPVVDRPLFVLEEGE